MLKKLLGLLDPDEQRQARILLAMIFIMALLDIIGVASIMPFIAVLTNPQLVETNAFLNSAFTAANDFGINTTEQFLFVLGIFVFLLLLVSLAFNALTTFVQLRFALMREYSISRRLVEGYLHQPYSWFLNRHSADLGKTILSEVKEVIDKAFMPMMNLITRGAVASALLMLLILIDLKLALIVGLTLVMAYVLIFKFTRGLLARIGVERGKANLGRFNAVSEAFGACKEVKVGGLEQVYIRRFSSYAQIYARHHATALVISQLPRFALEAIAFGGMMVVVLYLMTQRGSLASAMPIIALYAFAGYRLMPALQQVYSAVTQLRFAGPALDDLHSDLMSLQPDQANLSQGAITPKKVITLTNISYSYPNASQPVLKNLNLTIHAKSTVGLVGTTGSGKTTTVDLILGLLKAQQGTLAVDDQAITQHNKRSWQRAIGYVPQQIYLADDTVAANIAFGMDFKDIDLDALVRAAKIANLHEFVQNQLPLKYQTIVGERGVRLSGGQRQRIGIARALYRNPQVLILDEATSALDSLTEHAVMEAVYNLEHRITIIIIAHRLSTVKACDTIFLLERGELKGQGTYTELSESSKLFQEMIGITS
jgi:ABC-type multidrug transport system fused ATPase/permease subunit